jgi:hypothetical protein
MAIFALTTDHGPRWDASRGIREQEAWDEHASFMDGLVDDGFLLLGGPLGDGEHTLHMVEAADEDEVRTRMGEDPWASMGLLRIGALERWSIWLGSRPAAQWLRWLATLSVNLENNTGSDTVYAYVTGQVLDNGNALTLLESDGQTPYYPASPAPTGSPLAVDCAIPLGASGGAPTPVTIPHLAGARIWFSIGSPLEFLLNPGPALVEPSVTNPSDPSIDLQWDFCELTYNDAQLFANISFVDFVCIPVALTLTGSAGIQAVPGLPGGGLDTVCAGLAAQAAADGNRWNDLIISRNGTNLRALSPTNAMVLNPGLLAGYYGGYGDPGLAAVHRHAADRGHPGVVRHGDRRGVRRPADLRRGRILRPAHGRRHLQLQQRAVQSGRDECRNAGDPAPPGGRIQPQHLAYRRQPAGRREPGRLLRQRDHQSLRADRSRDHDRRARIRIPV